MIWVDLPKGWVDNVVLSDSDKAVLMDKKKILPADDYRVFYTRYLRQSWILQNNKEFDELVAIRQKELDDESRPLTKDEMWYVWYAGFVVLFTFCIVGVSFEKGLSGEISWSLSWSIIMIWTCIVIAYHYIFVQEYDNTDVN